MQERFIPEDALPGEHRDMAEKLAKSHGKEGGHTIPSVKKRKILGDREATLKEKEEWAHQNLWTDAVLGKLKRPQQEARKNQPVNPKEEPVTTEWQDGEGSVWGDKEWETEPKKNSGEIPGGFLSTDRIEQPKEKTTERRIHELAGMKDCIELLERMYDKMDRLQEMARGLGDDESKTAKEIEQQIKRKGDEILIIGKFIALIRKLSDRDEERLAREIGTLVSRALKIVSERIKLPYDQKNFEVYDRQIESRKFDIESIIAQRRLERGQD